jgi:cell division septation protein DedD
MKKSNELLFGIFVLLALGVLAIAFLSVEPDLKKTFPKDLPQAEFVKDLPKALQPPAKLDHLKLVPLEKNHASIRVNAHDQFFLKDKSYLIEVGIFKIIKEAKALVKKLQQAGFPAYIRPNALGEYVVLIGPQLLKEDAVKLKAMLEVKFNLKGNVINYVPTDIMREKV